MTGRRGAPDWRGSLARWDRQQESFNPTREARFTAMLDVLEVSLPRRFRALDLGCGPGSLSVRLLDRFPGARVDAVDYDPVVRTVGEGALGDRHGRLRWVDAKLGAVGWTAALPARRYDAAVSTTALHWLDRAGLSRLYRDLGQRLRPGGVFLNGDSIPWGRPDPGLSELAKRLRRRGSTVRSRSAAWGAWRDWWRSARSEPALRAAFREHRRRSAGHPRDEVEIPVADHVRLLRRAGFSSVGTIWQMNENRILYARRGTSVGPRTMFK